MPVSTAMTSCVVGSWLLTLDELDTLALTSALARCMSRAELYGHICASEGVKPFGLTALKQHLNDRCQCDGKSSQAALAADSSRV